jgi:hypothetical protein
MYSQTQIRTAVFTNNCRVLILSVPNMLHYKQISFSLSLVFYATVFNQILPENLTTDSILHRPLT